MGFQSEVCGWNISFYDTKYVSKKLAYVSLKKAIANKWLNEKDSSTHWSVFTGLTLFRL